VRIKTLNVVVRLPITILSPTVGDLGGIAAVAKGGAARVTPVAANECKKIGDQWGAKATSIKSSMSHMARRAFSATRMDLSSRLTHPLTHGLYQTLGSANRKADMQLKVIAYAFVNRIVEIVLVGGSLVR
jgi:hypothetical protein